MKSLTERARTQIARRYRQFREVSKNEGSRWIIDRIRAAFANWIAPKKDIMPVRRNDVLAADLSKPYQAVVPKIDPGHKITVNWVTTPPSPGSGGHTTMFRIIRYLEAHGYANRVYLYDVYHSDRHYYESIIRRFYNFEGKVASLDDKMEDSNAVVATSWLTAYPVFNSRCTGKRFYFVQDFEPYFYPLGALNLLAENTYRMGFHAITAGSWLAPKLRKEYHMDADFFEFGCDTSCYYRLPNSKRCGIVFFARPEATRRGFELGLMAIELFAGRRPEIKIHFYGDKIGKLPFVFIDHGRVTPERLNSIYNKCYAGLSLSLTNVSLVPHEMLAAGCIPVVNDTDHNRIVLNNSFIRYAPPDPHALASELEALVDTENFDSMSHAASDSVQSTKWEDAGASVDQIFRRTLLA